jgi:uncharacterized membrane protein
LAGITRSRKTHSITGKKEVDLPYPKNLNMEKKSVLQSKNFLVSVITLVLLAFEANSLQVNLKPEQVADVLLNRDVGAIVALIVMNFLNPIMKLATKAAKWDWGFLKSPNFWTQVLTVVLVLVAAYGIEFPENAAPALVTAYYSKQFSIIAMALVVNLINPLYHFFAKKKAANPQ